MKQKASILIVEDEEALTILLRYNLEAEGYAVDVVMRGDDAELRLREGAPDLLVLDWMVPAVSGIELCRRLRMRPETERLPIIMLTARGEESDRVRGLSTGADDYLVKPFAFVELLARVRALLRRGQPTPERLQVGDLVVDSLRRKVTRGNETIDLAPKEFGILEYMMRNKGRPLSRTMIVEHVWDMDYDGLTNIVDVYIRHLRSKIDDRYPQKLIHTIRGIGYMIEAPEKPASSRPGGDSVPASL